MSALTLLVWIIVLCLVIGIIWFAIGQLPLAPPLRTTVQMALLLILALLILGLMFGGVEFPRLVLR